MIAPDRLAPFEAHLWTLAPRLRHSLRPLRVPPGEPWQCVVEDPKLGPVKLSGRLRILPAAPVVQATPEAPATQAAAQAATQEAPQARETPAPTAGGAAAATGGGGELVVLVHGLGGTIGSHSELTSSAGRRRSPRSGATLARA